MLQAGSVAVLATEVATLEPLRGLANLTVVGCKEEWHAEAAFISLEPLVGLPALTDIELRNAYPRSSVDLALLGGVTALERRIVISPGLSPALGGLGGLARLRSLALSGFQAETSLAPVSCLTSVENVAVLGFPNVSSLAPLSMLTRLISLELALVTSRDDTTVSLEPLTHLRSLQHLCLRSGSPRSKARYNVQPLVGLSNPQGCEVTMLGCTLCSSAAGAHAAAGTTINILTIAECVLQRGQPLSHLVPLAGLRTLSINNTAVDLGGIGPAATRLLLLMLHNVMGDVSSLAPLSTLTTLHYLCLSACSHFSSLDPLTSLTSLRVLCLGSCPQLSSLSPLTTLHMLSSLELQNCLPQLAASAPPTLRPILCVV